MKQKDIAIILTPMLILTILWVIFSIYHNYTTSTIKDPLTIQIIPLNGNFDTEYVEKIKQRQKVEPLFDAQVSSPEELTPTPTPVEIPAEEIATESSEIVQ